MTGSMQSISFLRQRREPSSEKTVSTWEPDKFQLPSLTQADIEAFYDKHIKGQPCQLMIVGDVKKLDLKALARFGNIIKVKKDDIYKTKVPKK